MRHEGIRPGFSPWSTTKCSKLRVDDARNAACVVRSDHQTRRGMLAVVAINHKLGKQPVQGVRWVELNSHRG